MLMCQERNMKRARNDYEGGEASASPVEMKKEGMRTNQCVDDATRRTRSHMYAVLVLQSSWRRGPEGRRGRSVLTSTRSTGHTLTSTSRKWVPDALTSPLCDILTRFCALPPLLDPAGLQYLAVEHERVLLPGVRQVLPRPRAQHARAHTLGAGSAPRVHEPPQRQDLLPAG
jgi:hypothetical protein